MNSLSSSNFTAAAADLGFAESSYEVFYAKFLWKWEDDCPYGDNVVPISANFSAPYRTVFNKMSTKNSHVLLAFIKELKDKKSIDGDIFYRLSNDLLGKKPRQIGKRTELVKSMLREALIELYQTPPTKEFTDYAYGYHKRQAQAIQ